MVDITGRARDLFTGKSQSAGILPGHIGQANKQEEHASEYKNNDGGSEHDSDGASNRE
jgi:hypothetical protein